jgi:hypothetical protein
MHLCRNTYIGFAAPIIGLNHCGSKSIPIEMDVCLCVCFMPGHNSGTPGAISTKLGTHIAICMCKNLMYVLYIFISLASISQGKLDDSRC